MSKQRVMEDLDALLADLQSSSSVRQQIPATDVSSLGRINNNNNISNRSSSSLNSTPSRSIAAGSGSFIPSASSVVTSATLQTSYSLALDNDGQPLYETQQLRTPSTGGVRVGSGNMFNSRGSSGGSGEGDQSDARQGSVIYSQINKQLKTSSSSPLVLPAGNPALGNSGVSNSMSIPRSTLSTNLSELDSLLQELSSAQFSVELDRRSNAAAAASGGSGLRIGGGPVMSQPVTKGGGGGGGNVTQMPANKGASSATQELDDLMASLSGMSTATPPTSQPIKTQDGAGDYYGVGAEDEVLYTVPDKAAIQRLRSTPPAPGLPGQGQMFNNSQGQSLGSSQGPMIDMSQNQGQIIGLSQNQGQIQDNSRGQGEIVFEGQGIVQDQTGSATQPKTTSSNLNAMMADLDKNMSQQGVTTVAKGHCAACTKPIVGQVITALGRLWHPEHFTCVQCKEQIGSRNFFERDTLPYCERDYHLIFSPRCAYCSGPVLDKCVTALDKTWHPEHFCCIQCGKQLGDEEGFQEKDGQAYCREDYFHQFAPKCGGCAQPIVDSFITALNQQWHPRCFVCAECRAPFGASSFFDHEGLPYCETHFHAKRGSLCASCHKPITGRCITAMYKKFHPEHFLCTFCQRQLNKGTFKEENDKPYCHPCFVRLFS